MNSSCQVLSHSALLSGDNSSYWFPVVASQIFCMFTCRYLLLLAFSSSIFMLAHIFLFCNWTRKTFISALLTMQKPLTVWITKKLSKILKQMGIPDHLTCFLRNLYEGQGTADWKQIGKGEHQGCILSPYLFNLSAEYIMRNAGLEEAPKYFILSVAMVNGIVSLISLSVFSLFVDRNARDFCVLILYSSTLL